MHLFCLRIKWNLSKSLHLLTLGVLATRLYRFLTMHFWILTRHRHVLLIIKTLYQDFPLPITIRQWLHTRNHNIHQLTQSCCLLQLACGYMYLIFGGLICWKGILKWIRRLTAYICRTNIKTYELKICIGNSAPLTGWFLCWSLCSCNLHMEINIVHHQSKD